MTTKAKSYSGHYLIGTSSGLHKTGHMINQRFIDVLTEVKERCPVPCTRGAAGSNGEARTETPAKVYWVSQGSDDTDKTMVKYRSESDDFTTKKLGELIVTVAEEHGVDVSWDGDTSNAVCLGEKDYYTDLDIGTIVEYNGLSGTVIEGEPNDKYPRSNRAGRNTVKMDNGVERSIRTTHLKILDKK